MDSLGKVVVPRIKVKVKRRPKTLSLVCLVSVGFGRVSTGLHPNVTIELQKAGCGLDFTIGRTAELV